MEHYVKGADHGSEFTVTASAAGERHIKNVRKQQHGSIHLENKMLHIAHTFISWSYGNKK